MQMYNPKYKANSSIWSEGIGLDKKYVQIPCDLSVNNRYIMHCITHEHIVTD